MDRAHRIGQTREVHILARPAKTENTISKTVCWLEWQNGKRDKCNAKTAKRQTVNIRNGRDNNPKVHIYRLLSEHTVEENIWKRQLEKRKMDDVVVDQVFMIPQH